jgi:hypothetical protein
MGRWNNKVVWSEIEEEWLKVNRDQVPINQLSVRLSKSRAAVTRKLNEFDGKPMPAKKNKRSYIGKRPDLGISCRSSWEANILRYFNHLGWKWLYEPKVFVFEKERRGAISYLPDIYLPEYDIWVEVKGQLEPRARGAMNKFKKYYPDEFAKLQAITGSPKTKATEWFDKVGVPILFYYNDINRDYKDIIPHWE